MVTAIETQLTKRLGKPQRLEYLGELRYNCPFCKYKKSPDTKQHLYVSVRPKGRGTDGKPTGVGYICHRCGVKGSLGGLCAKLGIRSQRSLADFKEEVLSRLSSKGRSKDKRPSPVGWPEDYQPLKLSRRHKDFPRWDENVYLYAKGRGLTDDDLQFYQLGFGAGRNFGRLLIPILTADGQCDYWLGRDTFDYDPEDIEPPKYIGPRGPYRRWVLFNYHAAMAYKSVVLVEGTITAMVAGRNAVASLGKEISKQQLSQLLDGPWEKIYVCMDGEERKLTLDLCQRLYARKRKVFPVLLPHGEDAASVGRELFQEYLDEAKPFDPLASVKLILQYT